MLDHYNCKEATILGISMGAWLCVRAAAYEPRIARVIIMGVGYDFLAAVPSPLVALVKFLFRFPGLLTASAGFRHASTSRSAGLPRT